MKQKSSNKNSKKKKFGYYKLALIIFIIFLIGVFVLYKSSNIFNFNKSFVEDIPDISKTPAGQILIRDKLLLKLSPQDINSVFKVVDSIEADKNLSLNCHEIAHDIGHKAYELYGFSGAMNFTDEARLNHASVQGVCAGGYVHGVLEEASLHNPEFKKSPGLMCANVDDDTKASCFHGIGHALMFGYKRNVASSLATCRGVGNIDDETRCFEGVWMELFWGDTKYSGEDSLGFDIEKPLQPCIDTQNDAKPACFLYSTFGYLRIHKKDYIGAIKLCTENNLVENDVDFCLKGVGITMVSHFKATHLERSEIFVDGFSDERKNAFYKGVFGYANLSGVDDVEIKNTCSLFKNDVRICENVVGNIK